MQREHSPKRPDSLSAGKQVGQKLDMPAQKPSATAFQRELSNFKGSGTLCHLLA